MGGELEGWQREEGAAEAQAMGMRSMYGDDSDGDVFRGSTNDAQGEMNWCGCGGMCQVSGEQQQRSRSGRMEGVERMKTGFTRRGPRNASKLDVGGPAKASEDLGGNFAQQ